MAAQIASRQVLRYASYAWDAESALYYCSARYYDPATRQWTTGDPAKADGEESAYQYCAGEPVEQVDETGTYAYKFGDLNAKELALAALYPVRSSRVKKCKEYAEKSAAKGARAGWWAWSSIHNGRMDAFRHAIWNATMCQLVGPFWAKKYADAHENGDPDQPDWEKRMDLHNNYKGRRSLGDSPRHGWHVHRMGKGTARPAFERLASEALVEGARI